MISIVLYGRNDNYGYNLHKRAALGINTMAEGLTEGGDEILFVDYNTPEDHPTFPEAIADTLTAAAVKRLRVLRVRPALHERVRARTHLNAIEPIARNVAVRRSNPANRWILSTNTDMIFVPRGAASLSAAAATLEDGFYHIPRFELPESLWEGLDRRDPAAVIEQVRRLGRTLFLNEIVYGADCIKYDAPGDFQLILRDDLFRIDGFNEDMLLGWHVDSNIAKRLYLVYGVVGDVVDRLFGYHCDHTRQVTPMHQHKAPSNDARVFIDNVTDPRVSHQAATWGWPEDDIEEVSLRRSTHHVYMDALRGVLEGEWEQPVEAFYTPGTFGETTYDPRHVLPFLMDLFASAPRRLNVAWIGARADSFELFCRAWRAFGFSGEILVAPWSEPLLHSRGTAGARCVDREELDRSADVAIFDFGPASDAPQTQERLPLEPKQIDWAAGLLVQESFRHFVRDERARLHANGKPRQLVCINAIHNQYESVTREEIKMSATPFASRVRHGYVIPRDLSPVDVSSAFPRSLLANVKVGESGKRVRDGIRARLGSRGFLFSGPDLPLEAGDYQVELTFRPRTAFTLVAHMRPIIVEIVAASELLVRQRIRSLAWRSVVLPFTISERCALVQGRTEFRLLHGRSVDFVLTDIHLRQIAPLVPPPARRRDTERLLRLLGVPSEKGPDRSTGPAGELATASGTT
jgi:hypothetical protein